MTLDEITSDIAGIIMLGACLFCIWFYSTSERQIEQARARLGEFTTKIEEVKR